MRKIYTNVIIKTNKISIIGVKINIDIPTLILVNGALGSVAAVMLTINWIMNPTIPGTKEWCITLWCWAFSMLLLLPRGEWSPVVTIVIANGLVVVGSFYMLLGLSRYNQEARIPKSVEIIITALMFIGFYYFAILEPNLKNRFILLITFSAIAKFTALYFLWPTLKRFTAIGFVMGVGFFMHGLFFAYNAVKLMLIPEKMAPDQISETTIMLLMEVFLFMLWFTVSSSMLTNIVLQRGLKRLAYHDPLTGLLNRRSLFERCNNLIQASRVKQLSVLMLDLDYFKSINDKYGHVAGDKVLKHFVDIVSNELREFDLFGRIGGEEFLIAIPDVGEETTSTIAKRICTVVRESRMPYELIVIKYTVSIGHANYNVTNADELRNLIKAADKALYQAKENGRDRAESYVNLAYSNSPTII